MSVCKDCRGRGFWTEVGASKVAGEVWVDEQFHFCDTCNGKGKLISDDEIDDFDLAGVGVTEDDDYDD